MQPRYLSPLIILWIVSADLFAETGVKVTCDRQTHALISAVKDDQEFQMTAQQMQKLQTIGMEVCVAELAAANGINNKKSIFGTLSSDNNRPKKAGNKRLNKY